ncbi:MAG: glycosyltransferase family protein [Rhodospirillaceae bacterium]|jgi:spore coat polysaccharide biosynthesis protein SpsF|nr:glycosyltransferase family protein [Rhodospirillaceae bacterium]
MNDRHAHIKIVAIVQARMSSSRLPGKVLAPVVGQPMLLRQLERLGRARTVDEIVVATSTEPDDDVIADVCDKSNIACFRGSLHDVLGRYVQAATASEADIVLRLTADCPLTDPVVVDGLIRHMRDGAYDYASNTLERTWPHGLDVEAMTFDALLTAGHEADDPHEREHVTPFLYGHPDRFKLGSYTGAVDQSALRLTVDYSEDLDVVTQIYDALYPINAAFTTEDVVIYLDANPGIRALNSAHVIP